MKNVTWTCDRCSRIILNPGGAITIEEQPACYYLIQKREKETSYSMRETAINLCPYCQQQFHQWLNEYKPRVENTAVNEGET